MKGLIVAAVFIGAAGCSAQVDHRAAATVTEAAAATIKGAVVRVVFVIRNGPIKPLGSGFFISPDGHIVTGHHVLEEDLPNLNPPVSGTFRVGIVRDESPAVEYFEVEIVAADLDHDLAVLRVRGKPGLADRQFPYVKLSRTKPRQGMAIGAAGFPEDAAALVVTYGWVASAQHRQRLPSGVVGDFYLAQVPVNPGNSGGPIYRVEDGAVIGVVDSSVLAPVAQFTRKDKWEPVTNVRSATALTGVTTVPRLTELLTRKGVRWYSAEN